MPRHQPRTGRSARGVLFDARWSGRPGRRRGALGIARFSTELLARLDDVTRLDADFPLLHPLEPLWQGIILARTRPAVYVNPGFNGTPLSPVPSIFTIHDLIHLQFRQEANRTKDAYYRIVVRQAARRAAFVLTNTEHTKEQIVNWADIDPERVVAVGMGANDRFRPEGARTDVGAPYVLYVGNRKPHKNVERLLDAYRASSIADEALLVFAGAADQETQTAVAARRLRDRVVYVNAPDDEQLAALYRGALMLVFPSLYEGFGIPALEAMACGTPVVASETAGLGEVVGDAAVRVDPRDVASIAAGIDSIAGDEARAAALRMLGPERARDYTWERTVARVRGAIDAALDQSD